MKMFSKEIVDTMKKEIATETGVFVTSADVVKAAKESESKYTMAHGSHKQHSSSQVYEPVSEVE